MDLIQLHRRAASGQLLPAGKARVSEAFARFATLAVVVALLGGCTSESEQAEESFYEAVAAQQAGRNDEALRLLDSSLQAQPTSYAYYQRAKLRLKDGDDAGAIADCQAGLALVPVDRDLQWLLAEAQKPTIERFQGDYASAPSQNK